MTLSRMHEAGLIARPFRGMYTTLEQDAESKKRLEAQRKEFSFSSFFKSDATVTTDANKTDSPKESSK
jgi:hypothetical protein